MGFSEVLTLVQGEVGTGVRWATTVVLTLGSFLFVAMIIRKIYGSD